MVTALDIATLYVSFFEKRKHVQIPNAPLVPDNDPTTLFTSSGMQPLVPYLLGEKHPAGTRLVNVQNAFRAVDIDEIGDNRHTTFFRMLGNWSLGDYFKKEQLPWIFEFVTKGLGLDPKRLYATVFEGNKHVPKDEASAAIWNQLFESVGLDPKERIFYYGAEKNWWSRSGTPDKMPAGEPGGPASEIFYDFGPELKLHETSQWKNETCHVNCDCGRFIEICNTVFMQYKKQSDGTLALLEKPNVDFGGGLERFLLAVQNEPDVFKTNLFWPIIQTIAKRTEKDYHTHKVNMRIVADHFIASSFIILAGIKPSNKDQGYILRRLIRRGLDNLHELNTRHSGESSSTGRLQNPDSGLARMTSQVTPILEIIATQYGETDPILQEKFEEIKNTILEEETGYKQTRETAKRFIEKRYKKTGDELMGTTSISPDDAFLLYATHGLSPTQIKSLGFTFDEKEFAEKMQQHQALSRASAAQKFAGGLADHQEKTIIGHTATHLLHQALRDVLGNNVHQIGSNITSARIRFDFNYDQKLTDDQIKQVESIVNNKIRENLPVHFEIMPLRKAKETGAIGLFDDKYQENVKIYFIGPTTSSGLKAYSVEFCGGPHVEHTGILEKFSIMKQENIGHGQRRIYAVVG